MRKMADVFYLHLRSMHASALLPPKRQLPPDVERVCKIIGHREMSLPIEAALEQAHFPINSLNLSHLLGHLSQPKEALRVFIWSVRCNPTFIPDESVVWAILHVWRDEKKDLELFISVLLGVHKPDFQMTPKGLTILIQGYGWAGLLEVIVDLLKQTKSTFGFDPNIWHFSCAINCFLKESRFDIAHDTLQQMQSIGCHANQVLLDTLIKGALAAGQVKTALLLFRKMASSVKVCPGRATYNILIHGLSALGSLHQAWQLKKEMKEKGFPPDMYTYTVLIRAFCKQGKMQASMDLMNEMRVNKVRPDVVTFNILVGGFCNGDLVDAAIKVFESMPDMGVVPDCRTYNILINGLCKSHRVQEAHHLFEQLLEEKKITPTIVTFSCLMDGFLKHRMVADAYALLAKMAQFSDFDRHNYTIVLNALCQECMWVEAGHVLKEMKERGCSPNHITYNTWVHGCCKAGKLALVLEFLRETEETGFVPNSVTCNILIDYLLSVGQDLNAVRIVEDMIENGCRPDVVTVNTFVNAIAKSGNVCEAERVVRAMYRMGLRPNAKSLGPVVDGLCRLEEVDKALQLINDMDKKGCSPDTYVYKTIFKVISKAKQLLDVFRLMDNMKKHGFVLHVMLENNSLQFSFHPKEVEVDLKPPGKQQSGKACRADQQRGMAASKTQTEKSRESV
eukprot:c39862_g1_i1 orf=756-2786(-)